MSNVSRLLAGAATLAFVIGGAGGALAGPIPGVAGDRAHPALPAGISGLRQVKPVRGARGAPAHPAPVALTPSPTPAPNVVSAATGGSAATTGTAPKFAEGAGGYVEPSDGGIACDAANCVDYKNGGITVRDAQNWPTIRWQGDWARWFGATGGFFTDPVVWRHPYAKVFDGVIMWESAVNTWHLITFTTRGPSPLDASGNPNFCYVDWALGSTGTEWDYPHPSASSDASGNGFFAVGFDEYDNGAQNVSSVDLLAYPQPLLTAGSPCPSSVSGWKTLFPSTDFAPIPGRITDAPGANTLYGYSRAFNFPSTSFRAWKATLASNGSATFFDHAIPFPSGVTTTVLPGAAQKGGQYPLDPLDGRPGSAQFLMLNGAPTIEGAFGVAIAGNGGTDDALRVSVDMATFALTSSTKIHVPNDNFIVPASVRDRVCDPGCSGGSGWGVSGTLTGPDYFPSTAQVRSGAPGTVAINLAGSGPYSGRSCANDRLCRWGDQNTDDVRPGISTNDLALFATLSNPGTASGTNPGYQINVWGVNP